MIEALRKRHFQTAKDLLKYYQTEEKQAEIRKIIQERIRAESDWAELLTCFNSFI
jgi:Mg2+/Co2+ transporter CorC